MRARSSSAPLSWTEDAAVLPPQAHPALASLAQTAYYMSKFGMTMVALGAGAEGEGKGVTGNSLWPATVIESLASVNFKMGAPSTWRKVT